MSRSLWAVFLAAIFGLMGTVNQGSSPSKVEGRAKSEPQANFVGAVLDQSLRAPVHKIIGGTAALAPAEGVHQLINTAHATTNNTVSVKLSDLPVGKVIQVGELKFVKVREDQYLSITSGCIDPVLKTTNAVKDFNYTGNIQSYAVYAGCEYKLEVWGAAGGTATSNWAAYTSAGGNGGYSTGTYMPATSATVYIVVGGQGTTSTTNTSVAGGYNGGGASGTGSHAANGRSGGGGGGATHIALTTGLLSTLSSTTNQKKVLIVAGAGGGAGASVYTNYVRQQAGGIGGVGGGTTGVKGADGININTAYNATGGGGGSTTGGGAGKGGPNDPNTGSGAVYPGGGGGGGGGWYGGGGGGGASRRAATGEDGKAGTFGAGGKGGNSTSAGTGYICCYGAGAAGGGRFRLHWWCD